MRNFPEKMNIFLHRDDLRTHDNHGLKKASESGQTTPVYIEDPRIKERMGKNKYAFRKQGLEKLDQKYREQGSRLHYRKGKTSEELKKIAEKVEVDKIFFNRSYTPSKRRIEAEIEKLNLETSKYKDRLLIEPTDLSEEYDTFSPFYREWKKKEKQDPFGKPDNLSKIPGISSEIPKEAEATAEIPESGEQAAIEIWEDFRHNRIQYYKDKRDNVAEPESVSRLSMYYSSGMLGLRKVLTDVENLIDTEDSSDKIRNYAKYRNELAW
ncbi:MAG: hypothetical protein BRC26_02320, partial [Nanohaloarchaea archaeon QH_8_44_6]